MLEVVFSQSVRGSLRVSDVDSIGEVFCFELALDVGDIAPERFWDERETVLRELIAAPENKRAWGEQHAAGCVADAQDALERLLALAGHDGVRIWTDAPASICGACWLAGKLLDAQPKPEVYIVTLPDFTARDNGTSVIMRGWGEAPPRDMPEFVKLTRRLPHSMLLAMSEHWKQLQAENTQLRAMVNGRLTSVPETFYDFLIEQELEQMGTEFKAVELIINVMQRTNGLGDGFIWQRIQSFVSRGELKQLTRARADEPPYRVVMGV